VRLLNRPDTLPEAVASRKRHDGFLIVHAWAEDTINIDMGWQCRGEAMWPADNKQSEYGSIYPMDVDLLWVTLTRQQIATLQGLLDKRIKTK
jgi:hypothetical protein